MAHLAAEMNGLSELLESQVAVGMCREEVLEALFRSWMDRVTSITDKLQNGVITQLSNAIKNTPFSDDQKKSLARAILTIGAAASKKKTAGRPNQKCHNLENFLPEQKWVLMKRAGISMNTRLSIMAQVCGAMRLVNPDQPTLFRGVAIAEYCSQNYDASQEQVHRYMDTLKAMIKQHPENSELEYVINFPISANDLPSGHQAAIGTPLPVDVDIPDLATILGGNKMRGRKPKAAADPPWIASILAQVPDASAHDGIRRQLLANAGAAGAGAGAAAGGHGDAGHGAVKQEHVKQELPQAPPAEVAGLAPILRFRSLTKQEQKTNDASVGSLLKMENDMYDSMKATRAAKAAKERKEKR